jgi:hypothetical protein
MLSSVKLRRSPTAVYQRCGPVTSVRLTLSLVVFTLNRPKVAIRSPLSQIDTPSFSLTPSAQNSTLQRLSNRYGKCNVETVAVFFIVWQFNQEARRPQAASPSVRQLVGDYELAVDQGVGKLATATWASIQAWSEMGISTPSRIAKLLIQLTINQREPLAYKADFTESCEQTICHLAVTLCVRMNPVGTEFRLRKNLRKHITHDRHPLLPGQFLVNR